MTSIIAGGIGQAIQDAATAAKMGVGSENMDFEGVSVGISRAGMAKYIENLHANVLLKVEEKLRATEPVTQALNECWQGASRDKFLTKFGKTIDDVVEDLEEEYKDLIARLRELQHHYFEQDNKMLEDI